MNRKQAKALGLPLYQPESPCPSGHNGLRRASSGACLECEQERALDARLKEYRRRERLGVRGIREPLPPQPRAPLIEELARLHPDDLDALTAYAAALNLQRKIILDMANSVR